MMTTMIWGRGRGFMSMRSTCPGPRIIKMWTYVTQELPSALFNAYPVAEAAQAIMGHSMGGHGALTMAMSLPGRYRSVSALAPICNPTNSLWGRKQFTAYLGVDEEPWAAHDATLLMKKRGFDGPMLIDQGTSDRFLELLQPEALADGDGGAAAAGQFPDAEGL